MNENPEIGLEDFAVSSPGAMAWRRLKLNRAALVGAAVLAALYMTALFGSFISPYDPAARDYGAPNHPPTLPRFVDEYGKFRMRPFVYGMKMTDPVSQRWEYDFSRKYPLRFFVPSEPYKMWWVIPMRTRLTGVDLPGVLALFGRDSVGKDVFSRVIEGGKISLSIGLVGITVSLLIGMLMGSLAGYFGGWWDVAIMRVVEFLLSIPSLYLIIALRAYFQTQGVFGIGGSQVNSSQMYLIIVVILSLIGWAGQARVIRGMVLAIKETDFVMAERALGASTLRIITRHILPNTMSYVIISATIAVPGYILGEVALSYLGVGIQEPQVSWGIMLEDAQSLSAISNSPWLLFAPASLIFITVFAFNFLGDGLRDALDPKHRR
ncbi:MAG: ABC transporter permease [Candidatus Sumerlaeota bacterium]|nr:ABC transporter permease [Candidatus Sumerlaeota bacterium]